MRANRSIVEAHKKRDVFNTDQRELSRRAYCASQSQMMRCKAMLVYHFSIRNDDGSNREHSGLMALSDDNEAHTFGKQIIGDLMRDGAKQYAGWVMDVAEHERAVCRIPF